MSSKLEAVGKPKPASAPPQNDAAGRRERRASVTDTCGVVCVGGSNAIGDDGEGWWQQGTNAPAPTIQAAKHLKLEAEK